MISFGQLLSRTFTLKKVSKIPRKDALPAAKQKNNSCVVTDRCIRQPARLAERNVKFLLRRKETVQSIAMTVIRNKELPKNSFS